ncbi:MAG: methyltransferase dimerization domain-containing protein [Polyangiaceae bacterium]
MQSTELADVMSNDVQGEVLEMLGGYGISFAIKAAIEVGVFRALDGETNTLVGLANRLDLHVSALRRLIRVLVVVGFLSESSDGRYALTERGAALRPSPAGDSLGPIADYLASDALIQSMKGLSYSIRTGNSSFEKNNGGLTWYEYGHVDPEHLRIMDRAMEVYSNLSLGPLLAAYPFGRFGSIVRCRGWIRTDFGGDLVGASIGARRAIRFAGDYRSSERVFGVSWASGAHRTSRW